MAAGPVHERLAALDLVDHHCHGAVTDDADRAGLEALLTEGEAWPGVSPFDSPVGIAVRRHCAPLLDLPRHAPADVYVARRAELGAAEVNRRFLRAAGAGVFCVDTGFAPHPVTGPAELAAAAGATAYEVVRLEGVAEAVAAGGVEPDAYAEAFRTAVWAAVGRPGVVGVKSVAAYRTGFDLDPARPSPAEVTRAAGRWLARGGGRLDDPVLVRELLWTAVDVGRPLQLHTGFGDADIRMHRVDPTLLTDWLHLTAGTIPVLLLHCWPYQRQAAYLSAVFERVHLDVGLTLHHVGPARAGAILAEALEITPFRKLLYSSDAYGAAEFHHLGALAFRQGLAGLLQERVDADELSLPDALRLARWAGRDNARRVYGLPGGPADDG
ncbi:amidohydrolase [Streptomyces sp. KPB2]|uniref:amidohydrolase family protein n=1 Tax=unclassified Streptomyces TaxID=2593676 RepID=UPI000F6B530E|nr:MULTISPECIES: amidohydrolase family protein [unclassified Streptomyces]AZM74258.1 amidohydrolase [Streptomyces sp. KPB2]MBH5129252.1 amidohydrolase family protein [Streptomyces sp. HB-N217]MDU0257613.1 amidohydrolase family protein [Streptomyces sp. PU10]WST99951.1 amidohydrolase [Streptomyces sp. NBC_01124]